MSSLDDRLRKQRERDEKVKQWYKEKRQEADQNALLEKLGLQWTRDGITGKVEYVERKKHDAQPAATPHAYLTRLRENIVDCFNLDELRTLCFDLGIKYENLAADTLDGKARELVDHCKRVGKIPDLLVKCRERRPNVLWEGKA